jgi:hypothetical protein
MGTCSGKIFCPFNKVEEDIWDVFLNPCPSLVLSSTWVQLTSLPRSMMEVDPHMAAMIIIGRTLEVDISLCMDAWDLRNAHFMYVVPMIQVKAASGSR